MHRHDEVLGQVTRVELDHDLLQDVGARPLDEGVHQLVLEPVVAWLAPAHGRDDVGLALFIGATLGHATHLVLELSEHGERSVELVEEQRGLRHRDLCGRSELGQASTVELGVHRVLGDLASSVCLLDGRVRVDLPRHVGEEVALTEHARELRVLREVGEHPRLDLLVVSTEDSVALSRYECVSNERTTRQRL